MFLKFQTTHHLLLKKWHRYWIFVFFWYSKLLIKSHAKFVIFNFLRYVCSNISIFRLICTVSSRFWIYMEYLLCEKHVFCQNFAWAPSLARVFRILGGLNPPRPPYAHVWPTDVLVHCSSSSVHLPEALLLCCVSPVDGHFFWKPVSMVGSGFRLIWCLVMSTTVRIWASSFWLGIPLVETAWFELYRVCWSPAGNVSNRCIGLGGTL